MNKKPIVLIIRDGWGEGKDYPGNAVKLAKTPVANELEKKYPHILVHAEGEYVGLPKGQMGNSEVGHLNLGAGRIVYQSLSLINKSIHENKLKDNKTLNEAIKHAINNEGSLHIMGLLSDGGVHSNIDHIIALAQIAKANKVKVFLHVFLDGRDVDPKSSISYIKLIQKHNINIASISGRYYSMDRDKKWDREQLAYDAIVERKGASFLDPIEYINHEYSQNITDEFVKPAYNKVIVGNVKDNDSIIFANFRPDRARQLSHMFIGSNIQGYDYKPNINRTNIYFATLMRYDGIDCPVLFEAQKMNNLLGDVLEKHNLKVIRAAETEKYPHVTFFFDGGEEKKRKGEIRILVDSPKVATYDLKPEMSAIELTDNILKKISEVDVAIINYANADMVGHSGKVEPTIKAVETVDKQVGRLYHEVVEKLGGTLLVMADHGNAEEEINKDGSPMTAHTTNLVKLIITNSKVHFKDKFIKNSEAKLGDIAPTMLHLLGIEIPSEMDGEVLLKD